MNKSQFQPALVGAAGGAILMMVVGFGGLNWHLGNTVDRMVAKASEDSMVAALAPICAARFAAAAEKDEAVTADLMKVKSWQRDDHMKEAGYATFPGTEANRDVAEACVKLVTAES